MNIGTQICALRKEHGITQEKLAAEMGVTVGAVSKWENNITLPDLLMLCNLADYFHVTTDMLLGRIDKKTFMVCDDAPFIGKVLKDLMEREGYLCVGIAENEKQLDDYLQENIPDVLFLDVHLEVGNGLTILKKMKEENPSTAVIMVTADNSEETIQTAISYRADAYVTKPFLPEHILTALASIK